MYPKIIDVKIEEEYILIVTFENQVIKRFDLKVGLSDLRFENLKDKSFFRSVKIDQGGYGLSWNDEIDISEYEIWSNGELIN